jgi:fructose-bisphosphate aldolase class I
MPAAYDRLRYLIRQPLSRRRNRAPRASAGRIAQARDREQVILRIVEPAVSIDDDHATARCAAVTETVLHEVFEALHRHRVALEHMLLKAERGCGRQGARAAGNAC